LLPVPAPLGNLEIPQQRVRRAAKHLLAAAIIVQGEFHIGLAAGYPDLSQGYFLKGTGRFIVAKNKQRAAGRSLHRRETEFPGAVFPGPAGSLLPVQDRPYKAPRRPGSPHPDRFLTLEDHVVLKNRRQGKDIFQS
jgi:hypothetical protein